MQIVSIKWQKQDDKFTSGIMAWDEKRTRLEFLQIQSGERVSWQVTGPRMCIGFANHEAMQVPCPDHARASIGARCKSCDAADFYSSCVRCTGNTCLATPERWETCRITDYVVYLAIFGDSILKVGVSTENRLFTRWVEQGADFGVILERVTGGKLARQIESKIGKLEGIAKQVRSQRKVVMLFKSPDRKSAKELVHAFLKNNGLLNEYPEYMIIPLSKYYAFPNIKRNPYSLFTMRNNSRNLRIVGEVVGMKGSLLITDISHSYQIVDLKGIIGYDLNINESISVEAQSSLEEFF